MTHSEPPPLPDSDLGPQLPAQGASDYGRQGRRRHRRGHRSSFRRGRLWLLLIFFAFDLSNLAIFAAFPAGMRYRLLGALINSTLWSTFLLAAIWYRQKWARYTLLALQLLSIVQGATAVPELFQQDAIPLHPIVRWVLLGALVVNAVIAWVLVGAKDIKRLTSRAYE